MKGCLRPLVNYFHFISFQGKPGKDGDPGQSAFRVPFYYAMSVYVVCRVIMLLHVAFEYNIVFFREGLAPEVIQDIQGRQEGRSVIC